MDSRGILAPRRLVENVAFRREPPPDDLAYALDDHWIIEWNRPDGAPHEQETLGHPCNHVVIEPDGVWFYGVETKRTRRVLTGRGAVFGTKFRPGYGHAFTRIDMSTLTDRRIPAAQAFPGAGELDTLEAVHALLRSRPPDCATAREVEAAVARAQDDRGLKRVEDFAALLAVSPRTLQRLFRTHLGVTPKWVLRRFRLHDAAERIAHGHTEDFARLALDLGYFDQAHLINDFREVVGLPPAEYAATVSGDGGRAP